MVEEMGKRRVSGFIVDPRASEKGLLSWVLVDRTITLCLHFLSFSLHPSVSNDSLCLFRVGEEEWEPLIVLKIGSTMKRSIEKMAPKTVSKRQKSKREEEEEEE